MNSRLNSVFGAFLLAAALGGVSAVACARQDAAAVYGTAPTPQTEGASASQAQGAPAAGAEYQFEVVAIKPSSGDNRFFRSVWVADGFNADGMTVKALINSAYEISNNNQLSGGPGWIDSDRYNIQAKIEPSVADALKKLPRDEENAVDRKMLQEMLADRFGLKIHRETKELPIYVLTVAKNGPKLTPTTLPPLPPPGSSDPGNSGAVGPNAKDAKSAPPRPPAMRAGPDGTIQMPNGFRGAMITMSHGKTTMAMNGASISMLMSQLSRSLGRVVVDKTGLTGEYDFTLQWSSDVATPLANSAATGGPAPAAAPATPLPDSGPTIFAALQEQLGLKLESVKGPVEIFVIDQVERPSEN